MSGFKVRGATPVPVARPTEFELVHDAKKNGGNMWLRAYNPNNGKKYRVLTLKNGDNGAIVIHGRNANIGFRTNTNGTPCVEYVR